MELKINLRIFGVYKHIMTQLQKETIELIKSGHSVSEIAKKLNRNMSSISTIVKRCNITSYKKLNENKCDHNYFDKVTTETQAYLLGFFIADGWLSENRFGVQIQEEDSYILNHYQHFSKAKIFTINRTTNTISRKNQCTIKWTSGHMRETFEGLNILQNKTYHTDFLFPFHKIPPELHRHVVRGFLDGDGGIESNKGTFTIVLVSTSEGFLKQLGEHITTLYEGIGIKISKKQGKTVNYYSLRFNFNRCNKPAKVTQIYNYLYKDLSIFLSRKKKKFESYLEYRGKLEN